MVELKCGVDTNFSACARPSLMAQNCQKILSYV